MNHTKHKMPFGLYVLGLILAGLAGIIIALLLIAAERKPAPAPVITTTHHVPHRVERIDSSRIYVSYALDDLQEAQR